jgi:acetolactate synthase-1/2/3 large subunit
MLDSKEPYLLDVIVPFTEHVLPMIPSGQTVREIIIEKDVKADLGNNLGL